MVNGKKLLLATGLVASGLLSQVEAGDKKGTSEVVEVSTEKGGDSTLSRAELRKKKMRAAALAVTTTKVVKKAAETKKGKDASAQVQDEPVVVEPVAVVTTTTASSAAVPKRTSSKRVAAPAPVRVESEDEDDGLNVATTTTGKSKPTKAQPKAKGPPKHKAKAQLESSLLDSDTDEEKEFGAPPHPVGFDLGAFRGGNLGGDPMAAPWATIDGPIGDIASMTTSNVVPLPARSVSMRHVTTSSSKRTVPREQLNPNKPLVRAASTGSSARPGLSGRSMSERTTPSSGFGAMDLDSLRKLQSLMSSVEEDQNEFDEQGNEAGMVETGMVLPPVPGADLGSLIVPTEWNSLPSDFMMAMDENDVVNQLNAEQRDQQTEQFADEGDQAVFSELEGISAMPHHGIRAKELGAKVNEMLAGDFDPETLKQMKPKELVRLSSGLKELSLQVAEMTSELQSRKEQEDLQAVMREKAEVERAEFQFRMAKKFRQETIEMAKRGIDALLAGEYDGVDIGSSFPEPVLMEVLEQLKEMALLHEQYTTELEFQEFQRRAEEEEAAEERAALDRELELEKLHLQDDPEELAEELAEELRVEDEQKQQGGVPSAALELIRGRRAVRNAYKTMIRAIRREFPEARELVARVNGDIGAIVAQNMQENHFNGIPQSVKDRFREYLLVQQRLYRLTDAALTKQEEDRSIAQAAAIAEAAAKLKEAEKPQTEEERARQVRMQAVVERAVEYVRSNHPIAFDATAEEIRAALEVQEVQEANPEGLKFLELRAALIEWDGHSEMPTVGGVSGEDALNDLEALVLDNSDLCSDGAVAFIVAPKIQSRFDGLATKGTLDSPLRRAVLALAQSRKNAFVAKQASPVAVTKATYDAVVKPSAKFWTQVDAMKKRFNAPGYDWNSSTELNDLQSTPVMKQACKELAEETGFGERPAQYQATVKKFLEKSKSKK